MLFIRKYARTTAALFSMFSFAHVSLRSLWLQSQCLVFYPLVSKYEVLQKRILQHLIFVKALSGKRDSNSRPQPWQGCALPTELFPQNVKRRRLELPRRN